MMHKKTALVKTDSAVTRLFLYLVVGGYDGFTHSAGEEGITAEKIMIAVFPAKQR